MTTRRMLFALLVLAALPLAAAETDAALPKFSVTLPGPITSLPFRVSDAEFSSQLDAIVAVAEGPNQLYIYRPATETLTSVPLAFTPRCVAVSPDGKFAAVGHDHKISYVNLETAVLVKTLDVTTDVLDILLAGNGFVYALPRYDQWSQVHCVKIADNTETMHTGNLLYAGSLGRLHPGGTSFYTADNGLSPGDIYHYDIGGGTAAYKWDSPYHGDYSMCGNVWISQDGTRLYTACGNVFQSTNTQGTDMTYAGKMANDSSIRWVSHSQPGGSIAVIPNYQNFWWDPQPPTDQEIHYYTPDFLVYRGKATLPSFVVENKSWQSRGRWQFFNAAGTKQYVIVQADAESGMLYDYGVVTIDCTDAAVSLGATSASVSAAPATLQVSVTGTAGCGWRAQANDPWLNSLSTGVSDGTVTLTVAQNLTFTQRTGTVTIGNATYTVTQAANKPTALTAAATSPASIALHWTFTSADHFEVWRSSGSGFALIASPLTPSYTDSAVTPGAGYAYKVRAVLAGGAASDFVADYAHTYAYTDAALSGAVIRAAHVTEVRSAVNAMRVSAGLPAATFTDPSPAGVVAKRVHITEIRDAIAELRTSLGMAAFTFTPLAENSIILAQTTQELRTALE
jgi:hypothetical protein